MDVQPWQERRAGFAQATAWFVRTAALAQDRWHEPGLGEWSVRDLLGHTSRALTTVETYLEAPAATVEVTSAAEYFEIVRTAGGGGPAAVAERGREAGAALGEDPAAAVAVLGARVVARLDDEGPDTLVGTPAGGMRLADYLPTRTFELTVHTCDLVAALGGDEEPPRAAAVEAMAVLAALAVAAGGAGVLLRAATGRGPLPAGFTVL